MSHKTFDKLSKKAFFWANQKLIYSVIIFQKEWAVSSENTFTKVDLKKLDSSWQTDNPQIQSWDRIGTGKSEGKFFCVVIKLDILHWTKKWNIAGTDDYKLRGALLHH